MIDWLIDWLKSDNCLQDMYELPWESIPVLRNQPVSRLPSVQFVNMHLAEYRKNEQLKRNKVFYIVNPDKDLTGTTKNFDEFLDRKR